MLNRFVLFYFLLLALPLDEQYWQEVFSIDWGHLRYGDIFFLAHYEPQHWLVFFVVSLAGAVLWKGMERERLYYWVRVAVRYRLAIAMIAYGFIKLFPVQAPYPSISNLNTYYGDFTRWKLFSLGLGIVPGYEAFLGGVEIVGGLLLLYRRSASIGALILAIFLGNVFMSNWAYGGGDLVYSGYLIALALFVLSYDAQRLLNLLVLQREALPNSYRPAFGWWRVGLKAVFIFFFVVLYGFKVGTGGGYQFPVAKGLPGASGVYNVREFILGKDTLVYSRTDTVRWQDVVFEKWATISIRSNRPVVLDSNNVERVWASGGDRRYELEGSAGRHYYSYENDTVRRVLVLRNKNPHYAGETLVLHYDRPADGRIVLSGSGIYAVLERVDKKYLLEEARKSGRTRGLTL